ncbi:MAG: DUF2452 domain-containing protein [Verrucomicrobiota bacterium JB023]|nr:DUF2452 domain-containing protein [Verrucomicrobiota bacterium JB023]
MEKFGDSSSHMDELANPSEKPSKAFLPYPTSTLSPSIVPNDLTSFKSRGVSQIQRDLYQKLTEIREEYIEAITHFNWNKLAYEAEIGFEPVVGQVYYLYRSNERNMLSMIEPGQWNKQHLATLRLNWDRQFELVEKGPDIEEEALFASLSDG